MPLNPNTNETVAMSHFVCFRCGVPYTFPEVCFDAKRERNKPLYCPNGHANYFKNNVEIDHEKMLEKELEEAKGSLTEARQEIVRLKETIVTLRSTAEQAEARQADADAPPTEPPATEPTADNPLRYRDGYLLILRAGGYLKCPLCTAKYRYVTGIRNHVHNRHRAHALHDEIYKALGCEGKHLEVGQVEAYAQAHGAAANGGAV